MKLVWSPETASKSYIDTVNSCKLFSESGEAELISAMAGGWNPKLIIEVLSNNITISTSIGLAIAAGHSGARHVCVVPDERSRLNYIRAMQSKGVSSPEMMVGEAGDAVADLAGVDFLVVDGHHKEFARVVRVAKLSHKGAVLVCRNASQRTTAGFKWTRVLGNGIRVVRSLVLPVGKGLDIAYVANNGGKVNIPKGPSRWIRHIDQKSGEEHVFRG